MNPDYPGPWLGRTEHVAGHRYVAVISRLTSPISDETQTCTHEHHSKASAKGCAELAASRRNHPSWREEATG